VGLRLRRFREERGLTQAALAKALSLSPSYVNQIESNQRPFTASVLTKLAEVFDVDVQEFSNDESDRLVAQLRDVMIDASRTEPISNVEVRELAEAMPAMARYLVDIHGRYRHAREANETITGQIDAGTTETWITPPLMPYEEVRDFFYTHRNYFAAVDELAEETSFELDGSGADAAAGLANRLRSRHGVAVVDLSGEARADVQRRFDAATMTLAVSPLLSPGQRAFQLATHVAFLEATEVIDEVVANANLESDETRALARIGMANYFAGALILPYGRFLAAAEEYRYDVELLQRRFQVGYETVAHRLSTLQRVGARGVPFIFVRVDRAGNVSKRQSATDFHFSRVGGSCPLWNVYEAFSYPNQIRRQLAQMPDGRAYLWIARTVSHHIGGFRTPAKTFAIALGCDLEHAHRLVYSDGLDLTNPEVLIPIGPGCRVCDREDCPQRAFPAVGKPLEVDTDRRRFVPYGVRVETPS
jgi:hypothetical protein